MGPGEAAAILFSTFAVLIVIRIPVSFALGLACLPVILLDDRLTPFVVMHEMWGSYDSFILLASRSFCWPPI